MATTHSTPSRNTGQLEALAGLPLDGLEPDAYTGAIQATIECTIGTITDLDNLALLHRLSERLLCSRYTPPVIVEEQPARRKQRKRHRTGSVADEWQH